VVIYFRRQVWRLPRVWSAAILCGQVSPRSSRRVTFAYRLRPQIRGMPFCGDHWLALRVAIVLYVSPSEPGPVWMGGILPWQVFPYETGSYAVTTSKDCCIYCLSGVAIPLLSRADHLIHRGLVCSSGLLVVVRNIDLQHVLFVSFCRFVAQVRPARIRFTPLSGRRSPPSRGSPRELTRTAPRALRKVALHQAATWASHLVMVEMPLKVLWTHRLRLLAAAVGIASRCGVTRIASTARLSLRHARPLAVERRTMWQVLLLPHRKVTRPR